MTSSSSRIFITGSSAGLGLMAGQLLAREGHQVVLHARNADKAADVRRELPAAQVVTGDLSTIAGSQEVARQVNDLGLFDAVIHNAALGNHEQHELTTDGLPTVFAVNTLAPFILTALIARPKRLIYMTSGMHDGADASLDDLLWTRRRWNGSTAYAESKLHDVMLAFAIARLWPDVFSNAVNPGWVKTRMGGPRAPDRLEDGYVTQAWLAVSDDAAARATGQHFYHKQRQPTNPQASDHELQDELLEVCARLSGVALAANASEQGRDEVRLP